MNVFKKITDALRNSPEILDKYALSDERRAQMGALKMEELHLRFSNGVERHYHRVKHSRLGTVMIVPMLDDETVLLIREYAAGTEQYELLLPKGGVDEGESILDAANRELKEEVGMGAKQLQVMNTITLAPTFMGHTTHIVLAQDLYEERLQGDEPEELEVIPWKLSELKNLVNRDDCTEARSMAALYMVKEHLGG